MDRLISAARKAHGKSPPIEEAHSFEAPLGFGTRVARLWGGSLPDRAILFERLAWRGLAFALAICAVTAIARETIAHDTSAEQYPYAEVMAAPGEELF